VMLPVSASTCLSILFFNSTPIELPAHRRRHMTLLGIALTLLRNQCIANRVNALYADSNEPWRSVEYPDQAFGWAES